MNTLLKIVAAIVVVAVLIVLAKLALVLTGYLFKLLFWAVLIAAAAFFVRALYKRIAAR